MRRGFLFLGEGDILEAASNAAVNWGKGQKIGKANRQPS